MQIKYIKQGKKYLVQKPGELNYFYDEIADTDGIQINFESNIKIAFIPLNEFEESEQLLFKLRDEIETLSKHLDRVCEKFRSLSSEMLRLKYKK